MYKSLGLNKFLLNEIPCGEWGLYSYNAKTDLNYTTTRRTFNTDFISRPNGP